MRAEDDLIHWLRRRLGPGNLLGDDAALLPAPEVAAGPGARWVATVDSQVAGVHHPPGLDPALVARRLLAVNLSDLAALGADPAYALLALTAAPGYDHRRLLGSLAAACAEAGVTLAGGDLAGLPADTAGRLAGGAVASLTLLGLLRADREPLTRGAARPGDALWVAGPLGLSAAGRHLLARGARVEPSPQAPVEPPPGPAASRHVRPDVRPWRWQPPPDLPDALAEAARSALRRHLLPEPCLALGRELARAARRRGGPGTAAMDLSDGLARDLPRLCRESGVGAEIDLEALPRAPELVGLADWLGLAVDDLLLAGGEDYALLFTLPEGEPPPTGFRAVRIGRVTEPPGKTAEDGESGVKGEVLLRSPEGTAPLPRGGWDHLEGSGER